MSLTIVVSSAPPTQNTFKIAYNLNGGSGSVPMSTYTDSSSTYYGAVTGTVPSREGYVFLGWWTSPGGNSFGSYSHAGDSVYFSAPGTITLYAIWAHTGPQAVAFDANGGEGLVPAQTVNAGVSISLPWSGFTKLNHYLSGWKAGSPAGAHRDLGETVEIDAPITFYAEWTHVSDTHDPSAPSTATAGQAYTYRPDVSASAPPWKYYKNVLSGVNPNTIFVDSPSWLSASRVGQTVTFSGTPSEPGIYQVSVSCGSLGNKGHAISWTVTVYPTSGAAPPVYRVSYDANGGTGSIGYDESLPNNAIVLPGQIFARPGYTQIGWEARLSGMDVLLFLGSSYTVSGDATLKARWTADPNIVVLHANGGSGSIEPYIAYTGDVATLPSSGVAKPGHSLEGWYLAAAPDSIYPKGYMYPISGSATFYAYWVPAGAQALTVTVNANGGSGGYAQIIEEGKSAMLPYYGVTKPGSSLQGFAASASATEAQHAKGAAYPVAASAALYAVWSDAPTGSMVTVTFNLSGGSGSFPVQTIPSGGHASQPASNPVKPASVFTGWKLSGGAAWTDWSVAVTSDIVLEAVWQMHFSASFSGPVATLTINGPYTGQTTIDWGDGTMSSTATGEASHEFSPGAYGEITVTSVVLGESLSSSLGYAIDGDGDGDGGGGGGGGGDGHDPTELDLTMYLAIGLYLAGLLALLALYKPALAVYIPAGILALWWCLS
jgi:uncharacterized repeat protein (TIGR02543 family)